MKNVFYQNDKSYFILRDKKCSRIIYLKGITNEKLVRALIDDYMKKLGGGELYFHDPMTGEKTMTPMPDLTKIDK